MILHIDDNTEIQELVRVFLDTYGYPIVQVDDGINGLAMIRQLKPNLVLLDLDLPGLNGMEVIKHVKADPNLSHIPIIAFSGSVIPDDRAKLLAAGFKDLLSKPTAITDLLKMVEIYYSADSPNP